MSIAYKQPTATPLLTYKQPNNRSDSPAPAIDRRCVCTDYSGLRISLGEDLTEPLARKNRTAQPKTSKRASYDDDGDISMLRLFWTSWVNAIEHRKYQTIHIWIGPTIPVSHVTVPASGTISS